MPTLQFEPDISRHQQGRLSRLDEKFIAVVSESYIRSRRLNKQ